MAAKHESRHNVQLTAAEIGQLWSTYLNDSMAKCMLRYFVNKVEDAEIKSVLEYSLHLSTQHLQTIGDIFSHENHPIPHGFTDEDVNIHAPRLFTDAYMLNYVKLFGRLGLQYYGFSANMAARSDVHDFFAECVSSTMELATKADQVLLSKGLYMRPPYIPIPEEVEFVQKQSFLHGFFGDTRPLTAMEITHLFANIQTNTLGKATLLGFAQTAKSKTVRQHFQRGIEIAEKHAEVFSSCLRVEDIPAPMGFESNVTDSTDAPFSDKLMMYHGTALSQASQLNYGFALGTAMRRDVGLLYSRLMVEVAKYLEDGANIMIDHEWLEKMPCAVERKALTNV